MDRFRKLKKTNSNTLKDLENTVDFDREQEDERDAIDDLDEVSKSLHGLRTLASLLDL